MRGAAAGVLAEDAPQRSDDACPLRAGHGGAGAGRRGVTELPAPRLTCREVVELVTDHHEHRLAPHERARVDEHLRACPDCAAYVDQLKATIGTVGRLREDDVAGEMLDQLVAAFRGWRDGAS